MDNKTEFGSIQVHKNALAEIITAALAEREGVRLIDHTWATRFLEALGERQYPGIKIEFDGQQNVTIEVKICVRYGSKIPEVAKEVQVIIKNAIEKSVDINLKEININVHSIDRG